MPTIKEQDDPVLFRLVSDANLLRQYDFLKTVVDFALQHPEQPISHDVIRQLNNHAVVLLCDSPGMYRQTQVFIRNSTHTPPDPAQVNGLMDECLAYVAANWDAASPIHLAAYILWRLNWIHPFVEGNGRTARATCYLVLCAKHNLWLPGANTIPKQIRMNRQPYYAALREADDFFARNNRVDVSALERYLDQLLITQLTT